MPTDIPPARNRPRLFYGWWIAVISAVCLFLGPIPIAVFSFGIFFRSYVQEFHSGRGAVSFARTLFAIAIIGLPLAGRLMDRFGPRKMILPSTFISGVILLSAYFRWHHIWQLYVFYLALGIGSCGITPVSYCALIARWFDRYRGLALGVMMLGLGLGAFIMPAVAQYITANFGWRAAFEVAGATTLLIAVPAIALFVKDSPQGLGLVPDGPRGQLGAGVSWREAWHDSTFWMLFCALIVVAAAVQGCFSHVAAILLDRGIPAQTAALATSLFGAGVLAGRSGSGYLLDRFFAPRIAACIFGSAATGIGLLRVEASQQLALTAAFLIGLGLGAEVDVMAYLTSRYFGLRSFGVINSVAFAGFGVAGGLGTYVMGVAFDVTGGYSLILGLFCILTLVGAALMLCLGPYRYQVQAVGKGESGAGLLRISLSQS